VSTDTAETTEVVETTNLELDVHTADGRTDGTVTLPAEIFDVQVNIPLIHQVVVAQLAAARQGTAKAKSRGEVSGGGAKPYRQKGTGRARQGSIRAPHWRGGGVAHGPKPRDYRQRTPKKMIRLALRSALSDRAADDKVLVLDSWGLDSPSTKAGLGVLGGLGLRTAGERDERLLVVLARTDEAVWKSLRNLGARVQLVIPEELNTYDVLVNDWLVFTKETLEATVAHFSGSAHGASESVAADEPTDQGEGEAA
jgi:large subunit ribosomal protein L4